MSSVDKLKEQAADDQHRIWAHWMKWQFSCCEEQELPFAGKTGVLLIPAEEVERWRRQLGTDYKDLSEKEKESDRKVVEEHCRAFNVAMDYLKNLLDWLGFVWGDRQWDLKNYQAKLCKILDEKTIRIQAWEWFHKNDLRWSKFISSKEMPNGFYWRLCGRGEADKLQLHEGYSSDPTEAALIMYLTACPEKTPHWLKPERDL